MPQKKSSWLWKIKRNIEASRISEIKKEIKNSLETKTGLNQSTIDSFLIGCTDYIGTFGQDQINNIKLSQFPISLIVNTDNSFGIGEHWIFIHISKSYVEIYCPLGFNIFNFKIIPCNLLSFLNKHSRFKKIRIFRRVQSDSSILCGYFCILFAVLRPHLSYSFLHSTFCSVVKSRKLLLKFFR